MQRVYPATPTHLPAGKIARYLAIICVYLLVGLVLLPILPAIGILLLVFGVIAVPGLAYEKLTCHRVRLELSPTHFIHHTHRREYRFAWTDISHFEIDDRDCIHVFLAQRKKPYRLPDSYLWDDNSGLLEILANLRQVHGEATGTSDAG